MRTDGDSILPLSSASRYSSNEVMGICQSQYGLIWSFIKSQMFSSPM